MDPRRWLGVKRTTISANHASREFLHKLNELRWGGALVDVLLTGDSDGGGDGEDRAIPGHKLLLCGCSPYFNTMFGSQHWDTTAGQVQDTLRYNVISGKSDFLSMEISRLKYCITRTIAHCMTILMSAPGVWA